MSGNVGRIEYKVMRERKLRKVRRCEGVQIIGGKMKMRDGDVRR